MGSALDTQVSQMMVVRQAWLSSGFPNRMKKRCPFWPGELDHPLGNKGKWCLLLKSSDPKDSLSIWTNAFLYAFRNLCFQPW